MDGHAWLQKGRPGPGAKLYEALEGRIPVIGVGKNRFIDGSANPVLRGTSTSPLYVSACGVDEATAVDAVQSMHGPHRFPTLLKWVDHLARGHRSTGGA